MMLDDNARMAEPGAGSGRSMQFETMHARIDGDVATITMDRPRVLNCLNDSWTRDFNATIDALAERPDVRVVVVRGAGRAFCSGIDLDALATGQLRDAFFREWEIALHRLETMEPITVAALHSHCLGGGLQLALACDLRVARRDARLGVTAVKEGIIPGMGMWRLARYVGVGRTKRLALTADVIDAAEALTWGLVDYVVDDDEFERLDVLTSRLRLMAPTSTRLTKKLVNAALDTPFPAFLDTFAEFQRMARHAPEHQQAMAARRDRRRAGKA